MAYSKTITGKSQ